MRAHVCVDMCAGMRMDTYIVVCVDVFEGMRDACGMRVDMCVDVCID